MNLDRQFGIEFEIASRVSLSQMSMEFQNRRWTRWVVSSDSTITVEGRYISQIEVKTPKLSMTDHDLSELKDVMAYLRTVAKITRGCGTHVHIDARGYDADKLRNLARFYTRYEPVITRFVSQSRMNAYYCDRWVHGEHINSDYYMKRGHTETGKYLFMSYSSYRTKGSIEFRGHHGTLNYSRILSWVKFVMHVVSFAHGTRVGYVGTEKMQSIDNRVALSQKVYMAEFKKMDSKLELSPTIRSHLLRRARKYYYPQLEVA